MAPVAWQQTDRRKGMGFYIILLQRKVTHPLSLPLGEAEDAFGLLRTMSRAKYCPSWIQAVWRLSVSVFSTLLWFFSCARFMISRAA